MGHASWGKGIALCFFLTRMGGAASAAPFYLLEIWELAGKGEAPPVQMHPVDHSTDQSDCDRLVKDNPGAFHAAVFVTPGREIVVDQQLPFAVPTVVSPAGKVTASQAVKTSFLFTMNMGANGKQHLVFRRSGMIGAKPVLVAGALILHPDFKEDGMDAEIDLKPDWWMVSGSPDRDHPGFWKGFLLRLTPAN